MRVPIRYLPDKLTNIIGSYIKLSNNTNKYNGKSC